MAFTESSRSSTSSSPKQKENSSVPVQLRAQEALIAVLEKKATDVVIMDMRETSGLADYFILCTGTSDIQVKAIAESVERRLKDHSREVPWHIEGAEHRQWILMDYVDIVIHIFSPERRAFYDLERLWSDAPTEQVDDRPVRMFSS